MIVVGFFNDKVALVSVGLGNTVINLFGVGVYLGLNGALGTFAASAIGSGNSELAGVYTWRGRLILLVFFLALSPVFMSATSILEWLGQNKQASEVAGVYIKVNFFSIVFQANLDLER
jgi:multidrug resistance protein, MATE family